jgi:hypothetical protein
MAARGLAKSIKAKHPQGGLTAKGRLNKPNASSDRPGVENAWKDIKRRSCMEHRS